MPPDAPAPSRFSVAAAFAGVWFIWGSTYLAIAWVLETLPPFLSAGIRFLFAGGLLLGWCALRGHAMPTRNQWGVAVLTGGLLFLGGNGGVVWAEQHLASGLVALIVASVPAWMVLFEWLQPGGTRPTRLTVAGLILGFAGVAILVAPRADDAPRSGFAAFAGLIVVGGSACWALGSILSRRGGLPPSPLVGSASQMIGGGACLAIVGSSAGEWPALAAADVSARSTMAFAYLIVAGSLIAFSCYAWLLRVSTAAKVSTYAYVNPVVAVALGTLAGEALHPRIFLAGALIIAGVVAITTRKRG